MKIFLAGKVSGPSCEWRYELVPALKNIGLNEYPAVETLPMGQHTYTGCFPARMTKDQAEVAMRDNRMAWPVVWRKAINGIALCDLFIVWADEDFRDAFATHVEIGFAAALEKCIVVFMKPGVELNDYWFAFQCAGPFVLEATDPALGVRTLIDYIDKLQAIHPHVTSIRELLNKPLKAKLEQEALIEIR